MATRAARAVSTAAAAAGRSAECAFALIHARDFRAALFALDLVPLGNGRENFKLVPAGGALIFIDRHKNASRMSAIS